jgi:hypothetical protein
VIANRNRAKFQLVIPDWRPALLNTLLGCHRWKRGRLKKCDRQLIGFYARLAGVPKAEGKHRVSLLLTLGPRQRAGDPDAYWKSVLDGLVHAGLLADDNRQGVELGRVAFDRGARMETTIVLEDVS